VNNQQPIIIEHHARGNSGGPGSGWQNILRSRRWSIAAVLALIEILYVVFGRPQWLLASALAFVVLVLAVMGIRRVRPGIVRDGLIILAIAQGLVLVIPIAITASFALGLLLAVLVIIGVVIAAFRLRA
jgi:hypothetical protein